MTKEGGLPDDIANIDHRKAIDSYLAAMEKVQASSSLTSEEQKELAAIYEAKMIKAGKANQANAEFQEFIAASKGNGENRIQIKNAGANAVKIACGGTVYTVYPGKEENCACSLKITYARQEGSSWKPGGQTISNDGDNCGKTINIQ